ncbi:MAG: DEAD/DEAH box helicase family protein, partial [Mariprofundaceae bacterium]|nr:DEAD/DEAH box helicase family protein [Mariprofundaceae bacterium]
QAYQTAAVDAVVDCFKGQKYSSDSMDYRIDPGKQSTKQEEMNFKVDGFKNSDLSLTHQQLLENIQEIQRKQNLNVSDTLVKTSVCPINIDVEMETGTGKTYVYIKTMFEFQQKYGWNKFIIVVPSIAIREGIYQSIELTREHFLEEYGKQVRSFIYSSKALHEIESFSTDEGINVMIINVQAFAARGKDARRIYEELDSFQSRRPIDVIKSNRPILIIDEPQKITGDAKKESKSFKSLEEFNPLMILNYSATHKRVHNKVHRLDALDAYNQKLVKKISVRGISVKGLSGTHAYLYFQSIEISASKPPIARLEIEVKTKIGIKRVLRKLKNGDNLYDISGELEQYKGFTVSDIDARSDVISFANGHELQAGEATGNVDEATLRRIQIREAIKAHLEKEQVLFEQGIKVLTLFFIDEVAKYRSYSDEGEQAGEYAQIFEEEYQEAIKELGTLLQPEYTKYLQGIDVDQTHNGYFSIDKKSKRLTDPKVTARGENAGNADDVDAYDLILKDKKRLLSFEEPTRFIFSHSALREGWDNPNVFVICTLKHSDNTISRRQEVGRGMRICVNKDGKRMDDPATVHQTNVLTVVASESYQEFVSGLQKDISESLTDRPSVADEDFFLGKVLNTDVGKKTVDGKMARQIYKYLLKNDYIDDDDKIADAYHEARREKALQALPDDLVAYSEPVFLLIDSVFSAAQMPEIGDDRKAKINPLNQKNFDKKEFQALWNKINRKAVYTVHYDSGELIKNCIRELDSKLKVESLSYLVEQGEQKTDISYDQMKDNDGFKNTGHETIKKESSVCSAVKYDLIGKLASETKLTRSSITKILTGIQENTFYKYKVNPEDFMLHVSRLINEQKATTVVEHLTYDTISEQHNSDIFTKEKPKGSFEKAIKVHNHIYDYVFTDSKTERAFVNKLDTATEVVVYAKLPTAFFIPTPVGHYNPDWAIAFKKGSVKHIYFIAETKGSMSSMDLKKIEIVKTECAQKFFAEISSDQVKYDVVDSYGALMNIVQ